MKKRDKVYHFGLFRDASVRRMSKFVRSGKGAIAILVTVARSASEAREHFHNWHVEESQ